MNRHTIQRYRTWAATQGLLDQPIPPRKAPQPWIATTRALPPPLHTVSSVEPYRDLIVRLHREGVAETTVLQRL